MIAYSHATGPYTIDQLGGEHCARCARPFRIGEKSRPFKRVAEWTLFAHVTCPDQIRDGVRVSLYVNDVGADVTGIVLRVYADTAGTRVADVRLHNGRVFPQNIKFLTVVSA